MPESPWRRLAKSEPMQEAKPSKPTPEARSAYRVLRPITTRWMDNDAYGHAAGFTGAGLAGSIGISLTGTSGLATGWISWMPARINS